MLQELLMRMKKQRLYGIQDTKIPLSHYTLNNKSFMIRSKKAQLISSPFKARRNLKGEDVVHASHFIKWDSLSR